MNSKGIINDFGDFMETNIKGLKHTQNRNYGQLNFSPRSALGYAVRKKDVIIEFRTDGKENDLSAYHLLDFINSTRLLSSPIIDDLFLNVNIGKKNKLKISINIKLPITSFDDIYDLDFRQKTVEIFNILIDKLLELTTPKIKKSNFHNKCAELIEWDDNIDDDHPDKHPESVNSDGGIDDNLKGYYCKDCGENAFFSGDIILYRYYQAIEDEVDYECEVLLPISLACNDCCSKNIYCNYKEGFEFFVNNKIDAISTAFRAVSGKVYNFGDCDGFYELYQEMGVERNSGSAANNEWKNIDESEIDKLSSDALVAFHISSNGCIKQDLSPGILDCYDEAIFCKVYYL